MGVNLVPAEVDRRLVRWLVGNGLLKTLHNNQRALETNNFTSLVKSTA